MRYHVLATDYDGTLASDGKVENATIEALQRFLETGRRLVMVTGRELPDLMQTCTCLDLFEWVVAENGGLLYRTTTKEVTLLADPPAANLVQALREQHVEPLSVGQVIIATWEPHQATVLQTIRNLGLELQVIFNKSAVMVLPAGVNKTSGLAAALNEMGVSAHNVIGVGDAENDHAFLRQCEVSAGVANALPSIKEAVDIVTRADHGAGVVELIEQVIANDLVKVDRRIRRHFLAFGTSGEQRIELAPYGRSILICGPSASGKSTVASRFVESLQEQQYQFCLIDPEGDYEQLEGAVVFGGPKSPPPDEETVRFLENPQANAVVCMTGMSIPDRPAFFIKLLSQLLQLRIRTGHPHWIVLDEAHHLMPAEWLPGDGTLPRELQNFLLITIHPELLAPSLLDRVNTVMAVGSNAADTLTAFAQTINTTAPAYAGKSVETGELLLWLRDTNESPQLVRVTPCRMERRRHSRKYALGELPPDRSFYFHGAEGKMNLRAQNLMIFLQLADGIDDDTWEFHLRKGDYSKWFRDVIKDENLSSIAERIESLKATPLESRFLIRRAVEQEYTLPASVPVPIAGAS